MSVLRAIVGRLDADLAGITVPVIADDEWPAYEGWCAGMPDSRDILRYRELARAYVVIVKGRAW